MNRKLVAAALLGFSICFTGCADPLIPISPFGYLARDPHSGYEAPAVSSGIDPITQAGIDAGTAATNDQSNQDMRDAAAAASAASAN